MQEAMSSQEEGAKAATFAPIARFFLTNPASLAFKASSDAANSPQISRDFIDN